MWRMRFAWCLAVVGLLGAGLGVLLARHELGSAPQTGAAQPSIKRERAPGGPIGREAAKPGINLVGSAAFRAKTGAALALVRRTRHSEMVSRYIAIIREARRSGMRADEQPPTYEVGSATWQADPRWYASTIVHDAVHSRLYHEARAKGRREVPPLAWTGKEAEGICLQTQLEALDDLKAPATTLAYVRKLLENPMYQGDSASWADYLKRDW